MASLNENCGPPLRPVKGWPASVNATMRTAPSEVLGLSAGEREIRSIRLSGKSET